MLSEQLATLNLVLTNPDIPTLKQWSRGLGLEGLGRLGHGWTRVLLPRYCILSFRISQ